jgi:hypothetical protein
MSGLDGLKHFSAVVLMDSFHTAFQALSSQYQGNRETALTMVKKSSQIQIDMATN